MYKLHLQIKRKQDFLIEAQLELRLTIRDVQVDCLHFDLAECYFLPSEQIVHEVVEQRVCNCCGLREYAGTGFVVLDSFPPNKVLRRPVGSVSVEIISRNELLRRGLGAVITSYDKSNLVEGKISLSELIRQQLA